MIPTLRLVGADQAWRPMSLFPGATFASFLSLVPALAMVVLALRMRRNEHWIVFAAFAVLATLSAVVGLLQVAGAAALRPYAYTNDGFATGFFANRNAATDLFAIGMIAIAALYRLRGDLFAQPAVQIAALAAIVLLLFATLATGSRAGIALVIVPVAFGVQTVLARARGGGGAPGRTRQRYAVAAVTCALLVGAAAGAVAVQFTALSAVGARFALKGDERLAIWDNTLVAVAETMPVGSGFGTFVPIYAATEPLDNVNNHHVNRAHNDYLEVALEGGIPGLALVLGVIVFALVRCRIGWRSSDPVQKTTASFVFYTMLVVALHSLVDYPLRNLTIMTMMGWAMGAVMRGRDREGFVSGMAGAVLSERPVDAQGSY